MNKLTIKILYLLLLCLVLGCSHVINNNTDSIDVPNTNNTTNTDQVTDTNKDVPTRNNHYQGDGWHFEYPKSWEISNEKSVSESTSGKIIRFTVDEISLEDLKSWIDSEIKRKLSGTEADQTLIEPLSESQQGDLIVFKYVIGSDSGDRPAVELPNTIFFDGTKKYAFYTHQPPVTTEEFDLVLNTFQVNK